MDVVTGAAKLVGGADPDDSVTAASRQIKYGGGKFKSEAQRLFMWAVVPDAAKKWAHNRSTRKSDWRGAKRKRPTLRDVRADASEEATMPELVIGAETEEDIAAIIRCLVASGISLSLQGEELDPEPVAEPDINSEDLQASAAIVASLGDEFRPPAEFFEDPKFTEGQRWVSVTSDGRVSGHVALWGECHIGYAGTCLTPELLSQGGFDRANGIGHVVTAAGEQLGTSPLAVKGGHAPTEWGWDRAKAHYDDPETVVADVVYGPDDHGIWFSGALRPTATPEMVYALRASGVSGDWRPIDGELHFLAACCVNNGGYPKMKARMQDQNVLSLVAAGGVAVPDPTLKCCGPIEMVVEKPDPEALLAHAAARIEAITAAYEDELLAVLAERLTNA